MPPVGQNMTSGKTLAMSRSQPAPAAPWAGNNLSSRKPYCRASMTSLALATPGKNGKPRACTALASSGVHPGDTPKAAPAAMARSTSSGVSKVPAPISASGAALRISIKASSAEGVLRTTSKTSTPPSTSVRASLPACAAS